MPDESSETNGTGGAGASAVMGPGGALPVDPVITGGSEGTLAVLLQQPIE